jgi:lipopolysaccharide export system protein LptC
MTDYFYQARVRDDPPEDEGEAPFSDATPRRNPYPPEDEAYWAEAGAAPEAPPEPLPEPLWYEDRVRLADGDVPKPPAPTPRRQFQRDLLPPATEPEVSLPPAEAEGAGYDAGSYWTRPAEEEAGTAPWPDEPVYDEEPAYGHEDDAAGWATAAEAESLLPETRGYAPGASAAAARAAVEAGERNIRFDPTKERGPEYHDRAARHSRHVRLLRIVLPTVAVLSVIGFFAVMSWDGDDAGLPALDLSGINFEDREITMDQPHISGFEGTKRAYEIHAAKATQALGDTKAVVLETIEAKFALGDNVRANLDAVSGIYDSDTQKLRLMGGIQLSTSNGYEAELKEADIDVEAGDVASDTGVLIRGKEGSITADRIEVLDRGKHVFFRGNVKVVYQPPETPEKKEDAGGSADASAPAAAPAPAMIQATPDGST